MKKFPEMKRFTLISLLLALALAGCQTVWRPGSGDAFSAEQAALNAILSQPPGRAPVVDPQSVQVLQSQVMNDSTFVMVRHEQFNEGRQEKCLSMYETARNAMGLWTPRSGGSGCSGQIPGTAPAPEAPVDLGGGSSGGGGPNEAGFSYANGLVRQEDIAQVRVTWNDGQQQVVPVVNSSYLALRTGQFQFESIEGLDADGEAVYSQEMDIPIPVEKMP